MQIREMDLHEKARETVQHIVKILEGERVLSQKDLAAIQERIQFAIEDVWDYAAELYDRGRWR